MTRRFRINGDWGAQRQADGSVRFDWYGLITGGVWGVILSRTINAADWCDLTCAVSREGSKDEQDVRERGILRNAIERIHMGDYEPRAGDSSDPA